jgi:EAL domain-containing protein (putative c-di-GMP-specific phosphodiesterase class I)
LKDLGVKLAIDDFGTGYSSLSYLKKFNIDKLKIDQSFIRDLQSDEADQSIVKAIIELGRNLQLTLIAEGVEELEQQTVLQEMGCDEIQGYYFSRPLPEHEFIRFLQEYKVQV